MIPCNQYSKILDESFIGKKETPFHNRNSLKALYLCANYFWYWSVFLKITLETKDCFFYK
jgi:hypothetical protein